MYSYTCITSLFWNEFIDVSSNYFSSGYILTLGKEKDFESEELNSLSAGHCYVPYQQNVFYFQIYFLIIFFNEKKFPPIESRFFKEKLFK